MPDASSEDLRERILAIEEELYPGSIETPDKVSIENVDRAIGDYSIDEDADGNYIITHDPSGMTFVLSEDGSISSAGTDIFDGSNGEVQHAAVPALSNFAQGDTLSGYPIPSDDITGINKTYTQSSTPSDPALGDGWLDTSTGIFRVYADTGSGGEWQAVPPVQTTQEAVSFVEDDVTVSGDVPPTLGTLDTRVGYHVDLFAETKNTPAPDFPTGMDISPDGTKVGLIHNSDTFYYYTLSTPYDITSKTQEGTLSNSDTTSARNVSYSSDGNYVYCATGSDNNILQFSLSTAYDLTTATLNNSVSITEGLDALVVKPGDDSVVYGVNSSAVVFKYDFQGDNDMSSVTLVHSSPELDGFGNGLNISPDGRFLFLCNEGNETIRQYRLETPFDVDDIADQLPSYNVPISGSGVDDVVFADGGRYMYIPSTSDDIIIQAEGDLALPATAEVNFDQPSEVDSWDLATFQSNLNGGSVTVNVLDQDGNVLFSDITQNFDISTLAPSTNPKLEVVFDGSTGSDYPNVPYAARRFLR